MGRLTVRFLPKYLAIIFLNVISKLFFRNGIVFNFVKNSDFFEAVCKNTNRKVSIIHKNRLDGYLRGMNAKLKTFGHRYAIETIKFPVGATVIDCGANIGELGVYLEIFENEINYIAFEPGEDEFRALSLNNPNAKCINKALWHCDEVKTLFLKSDTADNSLFKFEGYQKEIKMDCTSVDSFLKKNPISEIYLLKLEAEGTEPEVLMGSVNSLMNIRYISVDWGPERGLEQENTLTSISNILYEHGFMMLSVDHKMYTALFVNKAYL